MADLITSKLPSLLVNKGRKDGLIQWDESFIKQYPELEYVDTFRENGNYIFKVWGDNKIAAATAQVPSKIYHAGAIYALDNIVVSSYLAANAFPQRNDLKKILSIAYFLLLNSENKIETYEDFVETTKPPYQDIL